MPNYKSSFVSEILEENVLKAVHDALEYFFENKIKDMWPAAYNERSSGKDYLTLEDVVIVALPLDRIGGSPGASGAGVFVAYYSDHRMKKGISRLLPSPPLVVKVGAHKILKSEEKQKKLWPHLSNTVKNRFALPIELFQSTENSEIGILLAPFSSGFEPQANGDRHNVNIRDLWQLINYENELSIGRERSSWLVIVDKVKFALDTMDKAHRAGLQKYNRSERKYFEQYEWYLRGTLNAATAGNLNSCKLNGLFGNDKTTQGFGKIWPNPNIVIRMLIEEGLTFEATLGSIHGDLHPKNIVLDDQGGVQIIDFGWACDDRHIIIDYLLLDINIRSVTLPSQFSDESILSLAGFLCSDSDIESLSDNISHRALLIRDSIWSPLIDKALVKDWMKEYLIPLFLVSYGLTVHLDSMRNQNAHKALVLMLSKKISDYIEGF